MKKKKQGIWMVGLSLLFIASGSFAAGGSSTESDTIERIEKEVQALKTKVEEILTGWPEGVDAITVQGIPTFTLNENCDRINRVKGFDLHDNNPVKVLKTVSCEKGEFVLILLGGKDYYMVKREDLILR